MSLRPLPAIAARSIVACLLLAAGSGCDDRATGVGRDATPPSLSLLAVDSATSSHTVTVAGTARDAGRVARVTVRRKALACCTDLVDEVAISPDTLVHFSASYAIEAGGHLIEVTAYDGAGNKTTDTLRVTSDREAPKLYLLAPAVVPGNDALFGATAADVLSATLTTTYAVEGGAELAAEAVTGTPAWYPLAPRPYYFATTRRVPLATAGTSEVTLTARDAAGNATGVTSRIAHGPRLTALVTGWSQVTGTSHWCALAATGAALCWGGNDQGQLGSGTRQATTFPAPVVGGLTFRQIAAGYHHTCGVTTSGALYCWGAFDWDSTARILQPPPGSPVPVQVAPGLTFSAVAAGWAHTCALATSGTAY